MALWTTPGDGRVVLELLRAWNRRGEVRAARYQRENAVGTRKELLHGRHEACSGSCGSCQLVQCSG
jgi:hypothetical protein